MTNPPFRSPRVKLAGLYHLARMLDKSRLHLEGRLPDEYRPNLGSALGLDGHLCGFLGISFEDLCERIRQGGSDEEIVEWCFHTGCRPNPVQRRIWNEFARKAGWNDRVSAFIAATKAEDGLSDRTDLVTAFDLIDFREGRSHESAEKSAST